MGLVCGTTIRGFAAALLLFCAARPVAASGDGGLRITCPDEGGDVFIDGRQKGECQFPIDMKLPEGKHLLTIRKDLPDGSFRYYERSIFIGADTTQRLEAENFETRYPEEYYWERREYENLLKVYPQGAHAAEAARIVEEQRVAAEKRAREARERAAKEEAENAERARAERERLARIAAEKAEAEKTARAKERAAAREKREAAQRRRLELVDSLWSDMAPVSGGCFKMGDLFGDGEADEKPVHEVCLSAYRIGRREVTVAQYAAVMGLDASAAPCPECPVSGLSLIDAQFFVNNLNARTGGGYKIPTEAQWEYAARSGGKEEKFPGGVAEAELATIARYQKNSMVKKTSLGVTVVPVDAKIAKEQMLVEGQYPGAAFLLDAVPVDGNDLGKGDVILAVDDVPLASAADLEKIVASKVPGTKLRLIVSRKGVRVGRTVTTFSTDEARFAPVGRLKPNGLGLYDMAGGVGEWVSDGYDFKSGVFSNETYYKRSPKNDPAGPDGEPGKAAKGVGAERVVRGGGIRGEASTLRTTDRRPVAMNSREVDVGLRLAYPAGGPVPAAKTMAGDDPSAKEREARRQKLKELLDSGLITPEEHDLKVGEIDE